MEHEIMNYRDFCNLLKQFTELRHAAELVTCPMDVLTKREELKQEKVQYTIHWLMAY